MSIPATQNTLFLTQKSGPLVVSPSPVPKPGKDEVLVKIHAAALNPADWKVITTYSFFIEKYPSVLGTDIAGEVVKLGEGVADIAIGDKVCFQGLFNNDGKYSGFQQYALADVKTLAKIPASLSYDQAASIPLALTTAWIGLYVANPHGLGFDAPITPVARGKYNDTPFIVLGGASSVGQLAIQEAKLSGFNPIITTASTKHEEFLKSLGATHVLDRNLSDSNLEEKIRNITDKPIKAVFDAISSETTQKLGLNLLNTGGQIALINSASEYLKEEIANQNKSFVWVYADKQGPEKVKTVQAMWAHVGKLLQDGDIKPNRIEVLPNGLSGIAEGLKRLEDDKVSGVKLIAHPQETA